VEETEISSAMQISLCVVKKTTKINVGCAQMAHDLVSPSSCKENITKDKIEELKNRCRSPHEETEISSAMSIKTLADVIVGCKNNKCGLSTDGARPCEPSHQMYQIHPTQNHWTYQTHWTHLTHPTHWTNMAQNMEILCEVAVFCMHDS